jgi:hypothetical protein
MPAYPYASTAKIQETLALIGEPYVGTTNQKLYQQICMALANRNAVGGDPMQNTIAALGGSPLATTEQTLLQQVLVLAATA